MRVGSIVHLVLGMTWALAAFGCSGLQVRVRNDPTTQQPSGVRVWIAVRGPQNQAVDPILDKIIVEAARQWLASHSYTPVDFRPKADTVVIFNIAEGERTVHVPGQSSVRPVYQPGTTSTVSNSWGQTVGTVTTDGTWGVVPQYREGYDRSVLDRALFVHVFRQRNGRRPDLISEGEATPKEQSAEFFDNEGVLNSAVTELLSASVLRTDVHELTTTVAGEWPHLTGKEDPGCWPRLGFRVGRTEDGHVAVTELSSDGEAAQGGLALGDLVLSVGGAPFPAPAEPTYVPGQTVPVVVWRGGASIILNIQATMICADNQ
jgi:hypothetical protein